MRWKTRLQRAIKVGEFTNEDKDLSGSFYSCAVGEAIPKSKNFDTIYYLKKEYGQVKARQLYQLGLAFYTKVKTGNIKSAQEVYNKIHKLK